MKKITREEFREINERAERERNEERERQKNIPKKPIYKDLWFLIFILVFLYIASFVVLGVASMEGDYIAPFSSLLLPLSMFLFTVSPFAILILTIVKARSSDKETNRFATAIAFVFYFLFRGGILEGLFGIMFMIFGITWAVKVLKRKK